MKLTQSISFKLIAAALSVVIVVVLAFGVYDYQVQSKRLKSRQQTQLSLMEARLQLSLPAAMWNFEQDQMQRILDSEHKAEEVALLQIYNDSQEMVIESQGKATEEYRSVPLSYDEGGNVTELGQVRVYIDNSGIEEQLRNLAVNALIKGLLLAILLIGALYLLFNKLVIAPLSEVANALENIARGEGDLTQRLRVKRDDEIGVVASSFNAFVEKIQHLVQSMKEVVAQTLAIAQDVRDGTSAGQGHLEKQQIETDQVAAAITQMSSSAKEIAQNVQLTADAADHVSDDARKVSDIIKTSVSSINKLSEQLNQATGVVGSLESDVEGIVSVLEVIRSIAEQTNLLALNAAIEAARAGDQGRGFAVVADEVRALASRTQESTAQIQSTIEKLQNSAKSAVQVMERSQAQSKESVENARSSGESIKGILNSTEQITTMATQIATAVEQQSAVAEELSHNVNRIVSAGHDSLHQLEEMTHSSQRMNDNAEQLSGLAKQFKA
ncbi:methyl-accepting chemotaxis protein [Bowmanella dokdonensis]|uniref:Methyl-accepting chemotaxis protein n=1 Tax=Bowmanella dokdonensis TaxID=751969 RepID=A0A939DKW7_9ALTE|nr:methyl-accepting chemotaxis protein [Bowmanella dokdonensis]MBN7824527.1 methyl-accepting chemotaxis protein [Bowmanella dokdonensis]